ncbi:PH domain-containing protein [Patescibacteria group bacterium]|nr:PH domain-containing protein [Patescibacteria group bacterium]
MAGVSIDAGEKVIAEYRRHWYVLVTESGIIAFLAFLPFIALVALTATGYSERLLFFVLFVSMGWLTILWSLFFIIWTNYYLDVWILTDRKIIDIEQYTLFSREVSEFRLDRVQDVTVEVKGIVATMLRFGTLHVETAGAVREFVIKNVPNPYDVRDEIMDWHDKAMKTLSLQKDG